MSERSLAEQYLVFETTLPNEVVVSVRTRYAGFRDDEDLNLRLAIWAGFELTEKATFQPSSVGLEKAHYLAWFLAIYRQETYFDYFRTLYECMSLASGYGPFYESEPH